MQSLQAHFALPDSTLLTPVLQDTFAVRLLVGRGYPAWWRRHLTDAEFAHNISCEWASLPDPDRDGASHYDGVGANHASTTLGHVYDMLVRARNAMLVKP
jgi:hypothetical protein